jgi:hypothetical protein
VKYDSEDLDSSASSSATSYITLQGDSVSIEGSGATVDGNVVTITSAGEYSISGVLNDGQIRVDTEDEETVVLVLNGADVACSTSAPIYVENADKVVLTLAGGTENRVTDGASYILEDAESDEPNAAIFSNDDLTINGAGALTVNANYNNGITSQDDLKITGGNITVNAVNDGVKGRDSIAVRAGTLTVNAGSDGLQSNNDEDVEKGYVAIEGGALNITAGMDGLQAETRLLVSDGHVNIVSGGGSANARVHRDERGGNWDVQNNGESDSAKGLKAGLDVTITGGTINIDSSDDAVHSNDSLTVNNGDITLASGDDGMHADTILEINGGDIVIKKSYEGIESASITLNGGNIHLVSSDDGINATSGGGGDMAMGGGQRGGNAGFSGNNHLYINDGYIVVDANGDGLDINGPIDMSGGTVLINGPTSNGNGPLDYGGSFNISGGFLVAAGSSGMAQAPSASSTQYSVMHVFGSTQAANTLVRIESQDGEEILTFAPTKEYQSLVVSSPALKNGETYVVYSGGSSSGALTDSLYSGGAYTPGFQVVNFTISSMVTGAGFASGGSFGGQGGDQGRPGGGGGGGGGRQRP